MRAIYVGLCVAPLLSGCVAALPALSGGAFFGGDEMAKGAASKAERREASVAAIGHDLRPRAIEIEDVEKGEEFDSWTAETAIGDYRCTQRKGRQTAICVKLAGGEAK